MTKSEKPKDVAGKDKSKPKFHVNWSALKNAILYQRRELAPTKLQRILRALEKEKSVPKE